METILSRVTEIPYWIIDIMEVTSELFNVPHWLGNPAISRIGTLIGRGKAGGRRSTFNCNSCKCNLGFLAKRKEQYPKWRDM